MALQHAMFLLQESEPEGLAEALGNAPMVEISRRQAEMCACSQKGKALATAERMRRYRERLKASPEKQAELKRKKAEAQKLWRSRQSKPKLSELIKDRLTTPLKESLGLRILKELFDQPLSYLAIIENLEERLINSREHSGDFRKCVVGALRRLSEHGCVDSEEDEADDGRKHKVFSLTEAGRRQLADGEAEWMSALGMDYYERLCRKRRVSVTITTVVDAA